MKPNDLNKDLSIFGMPFPSGPKPVAVVREADGRGVISLLLKYSMLLLLLLSSFGVFAQREFKTTEGDTTYTMKRYVFMLLVKGDNTTQDSLTAVTIQKGHMAHINKMAESGKLMAAGPFEKGERYRGLLVFDVETIDEAVAIESEDPAVKAGRLKMETFYWWAAKGTVLK